MMHDARRAIVMSAVSMNRASGPSPVWFVLSVGVSSFVRCILWQAMDGSRVPNL